MKLFWTGTDTLMLIDISKRSFRKKIYWLLFRIAVRIIDFFVESHYCDSENLVNNLRQFGIKKKIEVFPDKILHTKKYPKVSHPEFNVLYYFPRNSTMESSFLTWLYGYDIITIVKNTLDIMHKDYPHINFIEINGDADMSKLYPRIDFYIRPNRHDGASRIIQECEIQNIPYYRSITNPSAIDIIDQIKQNYKYTKK